MPPKTLLIEAFRALCDRLGGVDSVADEIGASAEGLRQVYNGIKLPSGQPRGLGPSIQAKLEAKYPGWWKAETAPKAHAAPTLADALPVVLDAMARAPDRARLRTALQALVEDDSTAYRQRLAELLAQAPSPAPALLAPAPAVAPAAPAIGAHRTNEGSVPFKWKTSDQARTPPAVVPPES